MTWIADAAAQLADKSVILCEAGHTGHAWRSYNVDNGGGATTMVGFEADRYRDTDGYCPGDDDVSRTLGLYGRWEPEETSLFRRAIATNPGTVIDFGTQVGWYTLLALGMGSAVLGVEAVTEHEALTLANATRFGLQDRLWQAHCWVDADTPVLSAVGAPPVSIVKIDLEGNDRHAVRVIGSLIDAGNVANILMECSPCFNDTYPAVVLDLMTRGYHAATVNPWREFGLMEVDEVVQTDPQVDVIFSRQAWWAR